jgi:hypothetical protein
LGDLIARATSAAELNHASCQRSRSGLAESFQV